MMMVLKDNSIWQRIVRSDNFPILLVVLLKVFLHLVTINRYGYFIDELYNIASAENLSSGFVEISHLGPMIYAGWISVFGHSMFSIRILALIPGVLTVFTAGLIARELGGKRFAQFMTALLVCLGPAWLVFNSFLGCDGFDQAASSVFLLLLIRIFKTDNQKIWIAAGIMAGVAVLFKQTLLFYLMALFWALLLTRHRKNFLSGYFWTGVFSGSLILAPYIIWQNINNWPILEYWSFYAKHRTYHASLLEFLAMQMIVYIPVAAPIWFAGCVNFIFNKKTNNYQVLGFLYIFLVIICFALNVKVYATAAIYPVLFASGFILFEEHFNTGWRKKIKRVYYGLIILTALVAVPSGLPVFNAQNQARYFQYVSLFSDYVKYDTFQKWILPQFMADRFGWEERVIAVADAFNTLSDEEKEKTSIYSVSYGFAAAIDLLGKKYNLPNSLCGHLSYYLWGYGKQRPEHILTLHVPYEYLVNICDEVEIGGYFPTIPYAMPYNDDIPIYICKKMKYSIEKVWPLVKHYD